MSSTEGTREILTALEAEGAKILYHDKNKDKGAALRAGFSKVTGDVIIIQDADLGYDPAEYGKLLWLIQEGKADVVYGSALPAESRGEWYFSGIW